MNQLSVVVCDEDSSYSRKLAEYLREKGNLRDVCVCDTDEAESVYTGGKPDVYLVDSAVWAAIQEKKRRTGKPPKEGRESGTQDTQVICLAADEIAESVAECPRIYKYQSADVILQELYKVIAGRPKTAVVRGRKRGRTIGLLSPWYDGSSLLAGLAVAEVLTKKGRVLYINSRGYHGMMFATEAGNQTDLSDVLLALRMQSGNAAAKIMSGIVSYGDFSCMVPVHCAGQIADITTSDYVNLLDIIWKDLEYDYVVVELQPELAEFQEILMLCDEVYCFLKREYGSEAMEEEIRRLQTGKEIRVQQFPKTMISYCDENVRMEPLVQSGCMREWMEQVLGEGDADD